MPGHVGGAAGTALSQPSRPLSRVTSSSTDDVSMMASRASDVAAALMGQSGTPPARSGQQQQQQEVDLLGDLVEYSGPPAQGPGAAGATLAPGGAGGAAHAQQAGPNQLPYAPPRILQSGQASQLPALPQGQQGQYSLGGGTMGPSIANPSFQAGRWAAATGTGPGVGVGVGASAAASSGAGGAPVDGADAALAVQAAAEAAAYESLRANTLGLPHTPQPLSSYTGAAAGFARAAQQPHSTSTGPAPGGHPGAQAQAALQAMGRQLLASSQPPQLPYQQHQAQPGTPPHQPQAALAAARSHLASVASHPDAVTLSQLDLILHDYASLAVTARTPLPQPAMAGSEEGASLQAVLAGLAAVPLTCARLASSAVLQAGTGAVERASDVLRISDVPVLLTEYRQLVEGGV